MALRYSFNSSTARLKEGREGSFVSMLALVLIPRTQHSCKLDKIVKLVYL